MRRNLSLFYEEFHKKIEFQKRIIGKKNFTYRNIIKVLEKHLDRKNKILDIGCGVGTLDFYLANKGFKVLGIDISKKAVEACRKNARVLGLGDRLNFERLNFPEEKPLEKFSLVICSEVLEHLKNDKKAVEVIFDLLRPGGIVIFSTPSQNAPLFRLGLTRKKDKQIGHLRRYTLEELVSLLRKQNPRILETKRTEGILRNFLFYSRGGTIPLKIANRFWIISDLFTFFDNITLKLFGEAQIIVVAQKHGKEKK